MYVYTYMHIHIFICRTYFGLLGACCPGQEMANDNLTSMVMMHDNSNLKALVLFPKGPQYPNRVESKTWESGPGTIDAGFPSSSGFALGRQSYSNFLASLP